MQHCIHSFSGECIQCQKDFYYDKIEKKCKLSENNFKNCWIGDKDKCVVCNEDFYLNQNDNLCYNNNEKGKLYKCKFTDNAGENCLSCENDYHLGNIDKICTNVEGCEMSDYEGKCLLCSDSYCLNAKNGNCKNNKKIYEEEDKIYFRCNKTNEDGTACDICNEGYILNEKGLCIDDIHYVEKVDGVCQKCQALKEEEGFFCLNSEYGCVITYFDKCLKCDDILDFDKCNICLDNNKLNENKICIKY